MKKTLLIVCALTGCALNAVAGDADYGSAPLTINYQGRLEKNSAPLTGSVAMVFGIWDSLAGGTNLWTSTETVVSVTQGIFGVSLSPSLTVMSRAGDKYLEITVDNQTLSPREKLQSVTYSLVSKRLENGTNLDVYDLNAANNVKIATTVVSKVGIGTTSPGYKLDVDGDARVRGDFYVGNTLWTNPTTASVGHLYSSTSSIIQAGGDTVFRSTAVPPVERMRLLQNGYLGIGTDSPSELLTVNGNIANSSGIMGIYPQDGVLIKPTNSETAYLYLHPNTDASTATLAMSSDGLLITAEGAAPRPIRFFTGGNEMLKISSSTFIQSFYDFYAQTGIKGGQVSVGNYSGAARSDEIKADGNLIMQYSNTSGYVGIGTNSPQSKLDVAGDVRAYGVLASSGTFASNLQVNGNLNANPGSGTRVTLSSTTIWGDTIIYGRLTTTGSGGTNPTDTPAYLGSTQTFSGGNGFKDVFVSSGLVVGRTNYLADLTGRYLYVVGESGDNARIYLRSETADSNLHFYRGASEAARLHTSGANNLLVTANGSRRAAFNADGSVEFTASTFTVSTAASVMPSIYVSPATGNVGINTQTLETPHKLTVAGDLKLTAGSNIVFGDGTTLNTTRVPGTAENVASTGDVDISADTNATGNGSILLKTGGATALAVKGGLVGIGTTSPASSLHVRDGNVRIGNLSSVPAGLNNIAVQGTLQAGGFKLPASGVDGYLLTADSGGTGAWQKLGGAPVSGQTLRYDGVSWAANSILYNDGTNIGVGTASPAQKLDVNGTAQMTGFILPTGAGNGYVLASNGSGVAAWQNFGSPSASGETLRYNGSAWAANSTLYNNGTNVGVGTASPTHKLHVSGNAIVTSSMSVTGSGISAGSAVFQVADSTFAVLENGNVGVGTASPAQKLDVNGTAQVTGLILPTGAGSGYVLTSNGSGAAAWQNLGAPSASGQTLRYNGSSWVANSVLVNDGTNIGIGATSTGAKLYVNGTVQSTGFTMASGAGSGYVLTSDGSGSATWQNLGYPTSSGQTLRYNGSLWVANSVLVNDGTNVGIGAASPGAKLYVNGTLQTVQFTMATGAGSGYVLTSNGSGSASWQNLGAPSASGQTLRYNGSSWVANSLFVNDGTNIGIGATSTGAKLHVAGNINTTGAFSQGGTAGTSGTYTFITDLQINGTNLEKKTRDVTVSGGIITDVSGESAWTVVGVLP